MFAPTRSIFASALAVVAFSAAGCDTILGHSLNRKFCEAHTDDLDCMKAYPDAAPDGPKGCTSDQQCGGTAPVCDLGTGGSKTCVECTVAEHTLCTGATPACIEDRCAKCTAHAQCDASNVCLPDGTCADAGQVAYVQAGATGAIPCTKDAPCGTLDDGAKAAKPTIKISGTVSDNKTTTIDGQAVTIVSDPDAKLTRSTPGIILQVQNDGADVGIYDLEITLGTGITNPAVSVPAGGNPKLSLSQVVVDANQGSGISTNGGVLSIDRSIIAQNASGGVVMSANGVVSITNSFIYRNGDTVNTSAGGLLLKPQAGSKVEFNTIVDNLANANSTSAGGVFCDQTGFISPDNIIFRNQGGAAGNVQTVGSCTYGNSINMPGTSTVDNSLGFVSPNTQPFDYHLGPSSPATVVDAAGPCTGVDFDGDTRPIGKVCDLGADERRQ